MFESHIQKVIFVDKPFLISLEQDSITNFRAFSSAELDTQIIALPLSSEAVTEVVKYVHPSDVRPGAILVKPDYSDRFISLDAFADSHAERKYRLWILLCLALGAKRVSVTNIEEVGVESDDAVATGLQMEGKTPVAQASVGVKTSHSTHQDEIRKSIMNIVAEAKGGAPDLERAKSILREHGLERDDMFRRMYDMRCLGVNSVIKQEFSLDMSSDVKRMFDSSLKAKVKLMSKLYGGSVDFEKSHKSLEKARTALKLTVVVEFDGARD